jgi:membrane-associated phospholipid phosphatase
MRLHICSLMLVILLRIEPGSAQSDSQSSSSTPSAESESRDTSTLPTQSLMAWENQRTFLPAGEDPENRFFTPFMKHLALDQKQFWTAPFGMDRQDAEVFLPFVAFTGGLIAGDAWISRQIPDDPSQIKRSKNISDYATYSLIGAAGASYLFGHLTHNDHLRETGFLAGEAALNSAAVTYLFKTMTQRPRPLDGNGDGTFFQGGASFPSEHSAIAWSVASVVAHEYPGTLTKIAAYGLASAVTLTRVTGKQHFPSDVVVGSALGWYFARQVYRAHHDPELGGTGWGNFVKEPDNGEKIRDAQHMGSPYVPLDSWVYPAVEKLASLGYMRTAFLGLKPWTRIQTANLVTEAKNNMVADESVPRDITGIQKQLEQEFAYEMRLLDGKENKTAQVESVYMRAVSISGPVLTDSYHFGQTLSDDFGRPFQRGTNGQVGSSMWAAAGPFTIYVRGEFQHAPSAPPLTDAERNVIASTDLVPIPAATPFASVNHAHLLEGYVAVNLAGWQISAGKQSLDWGPGPGGSLLWSDNVDPVEMVQISKSDLHLPILGATSIDQFFGVLRGHNFIPHPYIYGQKINFKPLPGLELGFGRTITIGGTGGTPLTTRNFVDSFFGKLQGGSVPGDSHTSMDWVFHIPKARNYLVFYGELYADDDPLPIMNLPKNPFRPGLYLTRFPRIPKLDLHVEVASTESPGFFNFGGPNKGNLNYWNQTYRDGYTNEGNLIGDTVGRMGRTIQGWLTYWMTPNSTLQFSCKGNSVSANFIPGGGDWQDYAMQAQTRLASGLYVKTLVQYEHISRYPLLFNGPQNNVSAIIELGFSPHWHSGSTTQ